MKRFILLITISLLSTSIFAQKVSISTNAMDWLNFGTVNLNTGISVARHLSIDIGGKFNNWEFASLRSGMPMYYKQHSASLGLRYWSWYVNSGWWIEAKAKASNYTRTGIWRLAVDDGLAYGGGISTGYNIMLNKHFNIELGLGIWGGKIMDRTLYHCSHCMEIREQGPKNFIDFDELTIGLVYVF